MNSININYDLTATLAERIEWWETKKSNCEYQLIVAQEHHDNGCAKNWKREVEFCNKNIKKLKEEQNFYAK